MLSFQRVAYLRPGGFAGSSVAQLLQGWIEGPGFKLLPPEVISSSVTLGNASATTQEDQVNYLQDVFGMPVSGTFVCTASRSAHAE
jgi:hypothetical protein